MVGTVQRKSSKTHAIANNFQFQRIHNDSTKSKYFASNFGWPLSQYHNNSDNNVLDISCMK